MNKSEEVLVVPLEVEVGSSAGLYSPDDVIDFGIGGSKDKPKQISLSLINSWKKMIRIHVNELIFLIQIILMMIYHFTTWNN